MGKPTILDVARAAGVALGTASNVINGKKSVNAVMRAKVERAIAELGYSPDAIAQSMRLRSTQAIGVIIDDINIAPFANFVRAAQDMLHNAGYVLILSGSQGNPEREIELLEALARRRVDGIIMTTVSERDERLLRAHAAAQVPIVFLDRKTAVPADAVMVDHRGSAVRAVEHLAGLGHQRIALITGDRGVRPARERIAGYTQAHQRLKLALLPHLIRSGGFSSEFGYEQARALLAEPEAPTAIVAGGVSMLPGVLRAVREAGLVVGQDVSVIGGADTELSRLVTPAVTVVTIDYAAMGQAAAELLLSRLASKETLAPRQAKIPTGFVERDSCMPPPKPVRAAAARKRTAKG
ncbi:MAG: transcriptional regulator, LacI family [Rhizobacter sp.]|nr:transcriptional regulator, LacI family [Rhizobacter sp.]